MKGLSPEDCKRLKKLNTPIKIQDFLDTLPINYEKRGETYMSVARALKAQKAHCFEGALIAAAAISLQGQPPLLLDLKADSKLDVDHVVALYKQNGRWGAVSKTNHAALRFRDPVYKTIRELAVSYFHEYFDNKTGKKSLRSFSAKPFNLNTSKLDWLGGQEELHELVAQIDHAPHQKLFPARNIRFLRPADIMERKAGTLIEWKKSHPGT